MNFFSCSLCPGSHGLLISNSLSAHPDHNTVQCLWQSFRTPRDSMWVLMYQVKKANVLLLYWNRECFVQCWASFSSFSLLRTTMSVFGQTDPLEIMCFKFIWAFLELTTLLYCTCGKIKYRTICKFWKEKC